MSFSLGPSMQFKRSSCAAIKLPTRQILVLGGTERTTEVLDIDSMTFGPGPTISSPKCYRDNIVRLDTCRCLVFGGYNDDTTEILDLSSLTFSPGPNICSSGRHYTANMVPLPVPEVRSSQFLLVGGQDTLDDGILTTKVLDLDTMKFRQGPEMLTRRSMCTVNRIDANRIIVLGGTCSCVYGALSSTEIITLDKEGAAKQRGEGKPSSFAMSAYNQRMGICDHTYKPDYHECFAAGNTECSFDGSPYYYDGSPYDY